MYLSKLLYTTSFICLLLVNSACSGDGKATTETTEDTQVSEEVAPIADNQLTEEEKAEGWKLLFNGEDIDMWRGAHMEGFPEKGWHVKDGLLNVEESGGGESEHGGDIVTKTEYQYFEFQLNFKLTKGANSGIKYYITEGYGPRKGSAIGFEFQLLDNDFHPDANKGKNGNRRLGSLYDLIPSKVDFEYVDKYGWNHARIVFKPDNTVEHWLNDKLVVSYVKGSDELNELIKQSKYKDFEGFGQWEKGRILLQDHGNAVQFKNIKIKELK